MQGRVTLFASGKLISTGAKSIQKSIEQLQHRLKLLISCDFVKRIQLEPEARNIVATMDFQNRLDLNGFPNSISRSLFEPEQFPGVIHKVRNDTTCLVFTSGKIVIAGAKSEAELHETVSILSDEVKPFLIKS